MREEPDELEADRQEADTCLLPHTLFCHAFFSSSVALPYCYRLNMSAFFHTCLYSVVAMRDMPLYRALLLPPQLRSLPPPYCRHTQTLLLFYYRHGAFFSLSFRRRKAKEVKKDDIYAYRYIETCGEATYKRHIRRRKRWSTRRQEGRKKAKVEE